MIYNLILTSGVYLTVALAGALVLRGILVNLEGRFREAFASRLRVLAAAGDFPLSPQRGCGLYTAELWKPVSLDRAVSGCSL